MKNIDWRRFGLNICQHALIMGIMLLVAGILFNSYITVETGQGTKIYAVDPLDKHEGFEESDLYHQLFSDAVSEIINLVVLKGELETEGYFNPEKVIEVTEYSNRKLENPTDYVKARYRLEDLIKWGKAGLVYSEHKMSKQEFMQYFPMDVTDPEFCYEHFGIDEYGQLYFRGFRTSQTDTILHNAESYMVLDEQGVSLDLEELSGEQKLLYLVTQKSREELEEMIFSYIMAHGNTVFTMSKQDDDKIMIGVSMLQCRYKNIYGVLNLKDQVDNWVDYAQLQNNLALAITNLYNNYEQYRVSNSLYADVNTNLKYCIRLSDGHTETTYSNLTGASAMSEAALTELFAEYKKYLIYYPDDLSFSGNAGLAEDDVYNNLKTYSYAFPDTTHIWMGIDTYYSVQTDAFYNGNEVYNRVVPNVSKVLIVAAILLVLWVGILIYLSVTTGVMQGADGENIYIIFWVDRIWTEVMLLIMGIMGMAFYHGFEGIMDIASVADILHLRDRVFLGINMTRVYEYGTYGLFGLFLSLGVSGAWYSLMRRIRYGNLVENSIFHYVYQLLKKAWNVILYHGNVTTRILIPYNLFLLVNLLGVFGAYNYMDNLPVLILIVCGIVMFDGAIGIYLFKQNAEQGEIVEGIKRIRAGEVEYKVDVENVHGANRELADAVNNIGEGIRIAVKTSMKDEQMKSDLITNVSHDIKTPLTSIISYVDLLKRLKITEEPARSYIRVLEEKSQRLKQLTDDLVEASKISSGNIILKNEKLNLTELVNQAWGEFSEKLEAKGLTTVFSNQNEEGYIYADSRRMWRVMENLFNNVCKYAMENTRIYIDLVKENGRVQLSVKNISAYQMNIKPEELTERFIRGDSARSTEGSGLGLSIAKSLTTVQGGNFVIYLDGDLFKVTLDFPEYEEGSMQQEE